MFTNYFHELRSSFLDVLSIVFLAEMVYTVHEHYTSQLDCPMQRLHLDRVHVTFIGEYHAMGKLYPWLFIIWDEISLDLRPFRRYCISQSIFPSNIPRCSSAVHRRAGAGGVCSPLAALILLQTIIVL